jgi:hypothetical protein
MNRRTHENAGIEIDQLARLVILARPENDLERAELVIDLAELADGVRVLSILREHDVGRRARRETDVGIREVRVEILLEILIRVENSAHPRERTRARRCDMRISSEMTFR